MSQRNAPRKDIKRKFAELDLVIEHAYSYYMRTFQFCYNKNNNNIYLVQLGRYPVAVVILHVYKL